MNIQGIVLGIGEHAEGAYLAAENNARRTGVPFSVVDKLPTGVNEGEFPGFSKLFFFDICSADIIFYLDADIVLLKDWDVSALVSRDELVAVRDAFIGDYPHWDAPVSRQTYFNSGMFIANRRHHAAVFQYAAHLWRSGTVPFGLNDQSALNHAVDQLKTPLHLIDERYNFLRFHIADKRRRDAVVAAHFTPHGYGDALSLLRAQRPS